MCERDSASLSNDERIAETVVDVEDKSGGAVLMVGSPPPAYIDILQSTTTVASRFLGNSHSVVACRQITEGVLDFVQGSRCNAVSSCSAFSVVVEPFVEGISGFELGL